MKLEHIKTHPHIPTSTFALIDGGERVGMVQIRHRPSSGEGMPPECASHIYYEVNEDKRRRGYGVTALELAKVEAARIGLSEIIVTCLKSNYASRRLIERHGGVFELSALNNDGETVLKFSILLTA